MHKVFGLGLSKTGTKTLKTCFETVGYSCAPWSPKLLEDVAVHNDFNGDRQAVARFDSFRNWPWPLIYKEMDRSYPASKFILTVRQDTETWLRSVKNHVRMKGRPEYVTQERAYGHQTPVGCENEYCDIYERHTREVTDHFRDRPEQLLVVCWETGAGWGELCRFLDCRTPNQPFPFVNKTPTGFRFRLAQVEQRLRKRWRRIRAITKRAS